MEGVVAMIQRDRLFVATLVAVFTVSEAIGVTINFKPAVNYPVGTNPVAVAAGDFDGDGNIDLAVVNSGNAGTGDNGSVSILLGNGDGTFHAAVNVAAGENPIAIVVADFNGDHRPDLAVINHDGGTGNIAIQLGNGDGTFQSPLDYAVASGLTTLAVGDFNGDNKPDLVVNGPSIYLLLGNGDGTLQSPAELGSGGFSVATADFNNDGNADLVLPRGLGGVTVMLGNGDGTFQPGVLYDHHGIGVQTAIVLGDFNGDGKLDVFLTYNGFNGAGSDLLVGNGDGTFTVVSSVANAVSANLSQADFNGDRNLDIVEPSNGMISVSAGKGDGTFETPVRFSAGSSPSQVLAIDLNGDESPDMVVANSGDGTISVLLNAVGTEFSISASSPTPNSVSPGQSATSTVSLSLLNAFSNPVSLTCSVEPAQAGAPTCTVNPTMVTFDAGGKASAQLTIAAGGASASLIPSNAQWDFAPWQLAWMPMAGLVLLATRFKWSNRNKEARRGLSMSCLVLTATFFYVGCRAGSHSDQNGQNYTVTVTATAGATQLHTGVTLTVR